ncbi:uncharacterized protein Dana_GF27248 [Drosophila ananassae]|uniref:Uncharacterized protein n=1 Tax=Drosophila ananassae TaxID=7217 RepID=A0A0P8ZED2_DROAN|nr:uncharacterized protein Dana_GF27248 [Drosophila ananassae]
MRKQDHTRAGELEKKKIGKNSAVTEVPKKNSSARKIPVSKRIAKKERESATAWGQGVTAEDKETCQAALAENLAGNLAAKDPAVSKSLVKVPPNARSESVIKQPIIL